jgi:demethylmenaquinone methyltransferase/2-methoxy-6-polyprenyl-1,4-benzoquinol methylase
MMAMPREPDDRRGGSRRVRDLFNETAPVYDRFNQIFSLGSGSWYRRRCLRRAGLRPGLRVLDVAVGTGLLAKEAVSLLGGTDGIIGIDLSEAMLRIARDKASIGLVQSTAEALPIVAESIDFLSMAYALRHIGDIELLFTEFHRVMRRGATILLLELSKPTGAFSSAVFGGHFAQLTPSIQRIIARRAETRSLMTYHWETIANGIDPAAVTASLRRCGFEDVRCERYFDIFRSFTGRKRA